MCHDAESDSDLESDYVAPVCASGLLAPGISKLEFN